MYEYDIVLLTESRYHQPDLLTDYTRNVLLEDQLVQDAFEKFGLRIFREDWASKNFDWSKTRYVIFRTTWDYFDRYPEFLAWLNKASAETMMINPYSLIQWNIDKHYLQDLKDRGINIAPTLFIEPGTKTSLQELYDQTKWTDTVLKPAISGGARHTYKLNSDNFQEYESVFQKLIAEETMLLQPFQINVVEKGECALMLINGKFTHAVLKVAKPGDFRVQDDHGGTVHPYSPNKQEIAFAEKVVAACNPLPVYARVDIIIDNAGQLAVSELELIEPEMWFRFNSAAADQMAQTIHKRFF